MGCQWPLEEDAFVSKPRRVEPFVIGLVSFIVPGQRDAISEGPKAVEDTRPERESEWISREVPEFCQKDPRDRLEMRNEVSYSELDPAQTLTTIKVGVGCVRERTQRLR